MGCSLSLTNLEEAHIEYKEGKTVELVIRKW